MIHPGRQAIASDGRGLEDAVDLPTVDVEGVSSKGRASYCKRFQYCGSPI